MKRRSAGALPGWLHSRYVLAAGCGLSLLVLGTAGLFLAFERSEIEANAIQRNQLFARVLEDQANRTLSGVELALGAMADTLAALPEGEPPERESPRLQQSLQTLPFLRSISLLDAQGRVLASSNPDNIGAVVPRALLLGRQTELRTGLGPLLAGRDLAEAVTPPAQQAAAGANHLLPALRPLPGNRLLVAAINPDYFANQYPLLLGDEPLRAALIGYDGVLIAASQPVPPAVAQGLATHPLLRDWLPSRERGTLRASGLDGAPAVLSYRSARRHPLVLWVDTPQRALDDELAQLALNVAGATAAVLAVLLALCALAWRSLRSHEHAQQDLAAARETLAAQDAFTDRLFQLSPVPMVVKSSAGRFMRVNQAWVDFTGLSAARAVGHSLGELYPPVLAAPHEVQEQMALAAGTSTSYEEQVLDADGLPRDVIVRVTPFTDATGDAAGVIACLMDVTEFREAETRTTEAKEAAERANATKTEFLANMSHELRTPLQIILGFSELGMMRNADSPRQHGMFNDVHQAGQRMLRLVNDLLDLSRIDSVIGDVNLTAQDIVPAMAAVVHELRPLAARRQLRLLTPAESSPLWAQADAVRLQQVLRNLLANAIRFSPSGTAIEVDWQHDASSNTHVVRVRDHGPGVPQAELEAIFEAFVQSSRTKSRAGGTGLGLAICRRIMAAHQGRVWAHNHPQGGAVFELSLPATHAPAGPAA
jgi:PAS domain S-box-containing protein